MKLTNELKNRIDTYFDNISAEELFEISVKKYNFSEIMFELQNESFKTVVDFVRPVARTSDSYREVFDLALAA